MTGYRAPASVNITSTSWSYVTLRNLRRVLGTTAWSHRDSVVVFEKSPRLRRPTYKSSSAYGHSLLLVSSDNYANEALAWQLAQCSMLSCIFSAACPFEECHVVFLGASNGTMSWEMGWEAAVVVL